MSMFATILSSRFNTMLVLIGTAFVLVGTVQSVAAQEAISDAELETLIQTQLQAVVEQRVGDAS